MLYKKRDLVSALAVTDKTLVVPKPVFAFEDRERGVLIVVPQTTRGRLRVRAESKLRQ
jgi:hypothetical protein